MAIIISTTGDRCDTEETVAELEMMLLKDIGHYLPVKAVGRPAKIISTALNIDKIELILEDGVDIPSPLPPKGFNTREAVYQPYINMRLILDKS